MPETDRIACLARKPSAPVAFFTVPADTSAESEAVIQATRRWLEKAVIGLNLCPFARSVHQRGQIRFTVSDARSEEVLLADLKAELQLLVTTSPEALDTTLLIHPQVLKDFLEYNAFLTSVEETLAAMRLVGIVQVASFHPQYVFAGTDPDDVTNCTNRAPFPTLHLLREASLERAIESHPDTSQIYEANMETMRRLGHSGWNALGLSEPGY
jgi:hypothetical protein